MTIGRYFSILSFVPAIVLYLYVTYNYGNGYTIQNSIRHFLTKEHPLISISDKSGNLYYHIEPYREVRFTLKNGLTWVFAPYNSTICKNDTYTTITFIDNYPDNKDNFDCYDNQLSNVFNLNIICDPLQKYNIGNVIQNGECNYELNLWTENGCAWLYSNKYEL